MGQLLKKKAVLSNIKEYKFANYSHEYKCYTATAIIQGVKGCREVFANELVTRNIELLTEGKELEMYLHFNCLKGNDVVEIKNIRG